MPPETRYAKSETVSIAYQVLGAGDVDLVVVPGWVSNLDTHWDEPTIARFLRRLARFARVILLDKRGTGLSDRVTDMPNLETRMDDVRAVMDAVGSRSATLFGSSEGGAMCALFAATYPERTAGLVLHASFPTLRWASDYPLGSTDATNLAALAYIENGWGTAIGIKQRAPSLAADPRFRESWIKILRSGASPSAALALAKMNAEIDIRHVLPAIRVPTLLLHSKNDRALSVEISRYMVSRIQNAKLIELEGIDHIPTGDDNEAILDAIEEFVTGVIHSDEHDRMLATVLFTDIVGSTERAAALGDRRWTDLVERHHSLIRKELVRFRGREIDTAGDGFLAAFDGPARAVRCACAIRDAVGRIGITLRCGLHTGECEISGNKLTGISVHVGARVAALAGPGEVLVSRTVKDLVAGSALDFSTRGIHSLKGISGEWEIYAVN